MLRVWLGELELKGQGRWIWTTERSGQAVTVTSKFHAGSVLRSLIRVRAKSVCDSFRDHRWVEEDAKNR